MRRLFNKLMGRKYKSGLYGTLITDDEALPYQIMQVKGPRELRIRQVVLVATPTGASEFGFSDHVLELKIKHVEGERWVTEAGNEVTFKLNK